MAHSKASDPLVTQLSPTWGMVAVPAACATVERQERVSGEVGRNCLGRSRVDLHHLLMIGEDRVHNRVNQIVRQVLVRHREVVQPDCGVVPQQRWISSRRNQRGPKFGKSQTEINNLIGREREIADLTPLLHFGKGRERHAGCDGERIKRPRLHLRGKVGPVAIHQGSLDLQRLEELRDIGAPGTSLGTNTDAFAIQIRKGLNVRVLQGHELEGRVVHREHSPHGAQLLAL